MMWNCGSRLPRSSSALRIMSGAWGGIELLRRRGIEVDVIAGSVTDSQMGEDYIEKEFGVPAANAERNGALLFELIKSRKCRSCELRV